VTIDHEGDVPVYLQLAAILRDQIQRSEIAPRRPLPSINRLSQTYGIARGSCEKAVEVLRREGLVRTVIGRGVYVVPPSDRP
jgi:GntR family transcriptional regulator